MGKRGSFFGLLRGVSSVGADDEEIDEAALAVGSPPPPTSRALGPGVPVSKHTRRLSAEEMFEQVTKQRGFCSDYDCSHEHSVA